MITRLPRGPYRTVPGPAGDIPWYMISFDRAGRCSAPVTAADVVDRARSGEFSDVVVFSHGWNNDWREATDRYESFVTGYLNLERLGRPRKALLVGVFWPSKILVGDSGRGPTIASADVAIAEEREDVFELGSTLPGDAAVRCYELLQRDSLTVAEAEELTAMFLPLLAADAAETAEPVPPPARMVGAWAAGGERQPEPDLDELGYFAEGTDTASEPETAGLLDYLDPRQVCRALSVWQMKDRAGAVGVHGIAPLLTDLQQTDVRVHCVGHSFGAKVMLSAITAAGLDRPVRSLLLLQPAVSHLCFADEVPGVGAPGGYRAALDLVELAVLSTFSVHDVPLRQTYHWALRRGRDLGEPEIAGAGEPPSRYAALGGYGPRGHEPASKPVDVADPGTFYPLTGHSILGIDASRTIGSHGGVSNTSTWWALQQLIHHGD